MDVCYVFNQTTNIICMFSVDLHIMDALPNIMRCTPLIPNGINLTHLPDTYSHIPCNSYKSS